MAPFWQKMRAVEPYLQPRYDQAEERENVVSQEQMDVIHKESLCINCGCCVSECNSMESDPDFLGPAALAKGMRFVGDPRDGAKIERLETLLRGARALGLHALLLLQRALPEGRRPARRDREARRRGDEERDRPRHGREAREVVRHLREDDRLAARDGARPEDAGDRRVDQGDEVRDGPRGQGQGAAAVPAARRGRGGRVARALRPRQGAGPRRRRRHRPGRAARSARIESHHEASEGREPVRRARFRAPPVPAERARRAEGVTT